MPNVISVVRLACLPLFLWLLFGRDNRAAAAALLAVLGATDWIDGYIARHWNQVSDLGKILDPVADRLLFFVGVGGILVDGAVPVWFAWAVLVREVLVAGSHARAGAAPGPVASTSPGSARPAPSGSCSRSRCSSRRTPRSAGTRSPACWPGCRHPGPDLQLHRRRDVRADRLQALREVGRRARAGRRPLDSDHRGRMRHRG